MKTVNTTTEIAIERIRKSAKHMPEVRVIKDMKVGQVVRQGDIYIERVSAIEGKGRPLKSRQLAPGTTKGSRHIVGDSEGVLVWESKPSLKGGKAAWQIGPAIESKGDVVITHPEHAWIKIVGGKISHFFQVFFQTDYARKTRTRD